MFDCQIQIPTYKQIERFAGGKIKAGDYLRHKDGYELIVTVVLDNRKNRQLQFNNKIPCLRSEYGEIRWYTTEDLKKQ